MVEDDIPDGAEYFEGDIVEEIDRILCLFTAVFAGLGVLTTWTNMGRMIGII